MSFAETLIISPHRGKWNGSDLILNRERVQDHGEVLTPMNIVSDMLDLVGDKYEMKTGNTEGMLPISKTFLEPACGTGNWSMRRKECHLGTSNINLDVLIKFVKTSSFPHLIFDSKTNKSVTESLKDNRYQLQTYVTEYNARHSNATGVVQYFMDENASKKDLSFNLTRLNSDIADLNMFVWVYQLKSDSDPKDFEDYLYNQLIDLLEL